MATFRYWRASMFRFSGQGFVVVPTFALKDHSGGTDLTIASLGSGGITSSQGFVSGSPASNAFDQNAATWWTDQPSSIDTWLQFDFLSPVAVGEATVVYHTDAQYQPVMTFIQGSDDLRQWSATHVDQPRLKNAFSSVFDTTLMSPPLITASEHVRFYSPQLGPFGISASMSLRNMNPNRGLGVGVIAGEVDVTGLPPTPIGGKQVRLHEKASGLLYATTSSASDGSYAFTGLPIDRAFYVIAFDDTLNYNAVIKDNIVPVLP